MVPSRTPENGTLRVAIRLGVFALASFSMLRPAGAACLPDAPALAYFPAPDSVEVPVDTIVRTEFPLWASDPPVGVTLSEDAGAPVPGDVFVDRAEVQFWPAAPLVPSTRYLAQFAFASLRPETVPFTTAAGGVAEQFAGLDQLGWDYAPRDPPCSALPSAFVFHLTFAPAAGIAAENAEYMIFQDGVTPIAHVRGADLAFATDGSFLPLEIIVPVTEGLGEHCFLVSLRNLAGTLDGNGHRVCVTTDRGPHFRGLCAVAPAAGVAPAPPPPWLPGLGLATLLALCARERRRRSG